MHLDQINVSTFLCSKAVFAFLIKRQYVNVFWSAFVLL